MERDQRLFDVVWGMMDKSGEPEVEALVSQLEVMDGQPGKWVRDFNQGGFNTQGLVERLVDMAMVEEKIAAVLLESSLVEDEPGTEET